MAYWLLLVYCRYTRRKQAQWHKKGGKTLANTETKWTRIKIQDWLDSFLNVHGWVGVGVTEVSSVECHSSGAFTWSLEIQSLTGIWGKFPRRSLLGLERVRLQSVFYIIDAVNQMQFLLFVRQVVYLPSHLSSEATKRLDRFLTHSN